MEKQQNIMVSAGKLFCISRGCYSDYGYYGHFLALQDITRELLQEIVDQCKAEHEQRKDDEDYWGCENDQFLPKLIQRGIVIDIDVTEIHTGDYSELTLS